MTLCELCGSYIVNITYLLIYIKQQSLYKAFENMFHMNMFEEMNRLGRERTPFVFIVSYDMSEIRVFPEDTAAGESVLYDFNGISNLSLKKHSDYSPALSSIRLVSFERYSKAFNYVQKQERAGNSYLVNLTFPGEIELSCDLDLIFHAASAKYRLLYKDQFTVFSPERFILIENNKVSTCPMKGTISADIPGAYAKILSDEKEKAEHITVVDLLRNDLGRIGKNIRVEKFRYIDRINTYDRGSLLQVSSLITADIESSWHSEIGWILKEVLPAGSVTGAPKRKTCEIIREAEKYARGFYTGIMGIYDGNILDSAVMIRFIEKTENGYVYKSGGGITIYSDCRKEYEELKDKIYVPFS